MNRARPRLSWVWILVLPFFALGRPSGSDVPESLKANLDLPYDATAESQEEEDAPEVILLYGGAYEATAVVFCLDESRSMAKNDRWDLQKKEATRAIQELTDRVEFGLVFYGQDAYAFRPTLMAATPANKQAAIAFIASRQMTSGTCLGKGAVKSLQMLQNARSKHRAVILAGDGRPTSCPFVPGQDRNPQILSATFAETIAANPGLQIRLHSIYVGSQPIPEDVEFLKTLASIHGGTFRTASK